MVSIVHFFKIYTDHFERVVLSLIRNMLYSVSTSLLSAVTWHGVSSPVVIDMSLS